MYMLSRLRLVAYGLSLAGAGAAAIAIVLIAAVILLEICLRTFFATSTFMRRVAHCPRVADLTVTA